MHPDWPPAFPAPVSLAIVTAVDLVREAEVLSYEVLGNPPLPALRELAQSAADMFGVRMAEINAVTGSHTVHLATSDDHAGEVPLEYSFCSRTVVRDGLTMVVPDARIDPAFNNSPYVGGPLGFIVFYAGTQLVSPDGIAYGTLCLWHDDEFTFSPEAAQRLEQLARIAGLILEMHRLNAQLASTMRRLADSHRHVDRSNESLEAFAGQISHDLRSPLATVQLALEMIAEHSETVSSDAEMSYLVERASGGAARMQRTIVDLMDFAVLGGGTPRDEVDLDAVMAEVVEDLGPSARSATVTVQPLPKVLANEGQVRAVVQNLVSNALKFAGSQSEPEIDVAAVVRDGRARVSICDNGPGVPEDQRSAIFGLMVRGDQKDIEGQGIGLATCARIIAAHGGSIGVDEAPGGGACFWFELPTVPANELLSAED